jgi:hypothetical protein
LKSEIAEGASLLRECSLKSKGITPHTGGKEGGKENGGNKRLNGSESRN